MHARKIFLLAGASLLFGVTGTGVALAEAGTMKASAATAAMAAPTASSPEALVAKGTLDENGAAAGPTVKALMAKPMALPPPFPPLTEVCLKITNPQSPGLVWYVNAHGVIAGPNFNILSGTIHGTICNGQWHVTAGSGLSGSTEHITGAINTPVGFCASGVTLNGSGSSFLGYTGHYGFNTTSPNAFNQQTNIIGVNITNCP